MRAACVFPLPWPVGGATDTVKRLALVLERGPRRRLFLEHSARQGESFEGCGSSTKPCRISSDCPAMELLLTNVHFVLIGQLDVFNKLGATCSHQVNRVGPAVLDGARKSSGTHSSKTSRCRFLSSSSQLSCCDWPPKGFRLTESQEPAVDSLAEIRALLEARESARVAFRQAMPKTMYWLGTSVMLNHILEHCWPHALLGTMPERLPVRVSDEAFCSAVAFVHRRFAYGHVLSVSAQEVAWVASDTPVQKGAG